MSATACTKISDLVNKFSEDVKYDVDYDEDHQVLKLIRCHSLEALPAILFIELRNLQELHIEDCPSLSEIPSAIETLTRLRVLKVAYCDDLPTLPPEIGRLNQLEELEIQSLRSLTTIPKDICLLENLKALKIFNCPRLHALPPEISQLKHLQTMELRHILVSQIGALPGVRSLSIHFCSDILDHFIESMKYPNSIRSIDLSFNQFGRQPLGFSKFLSALLAKCPNLEHLDLRSNGISSMKIFHPLKTTPCRLRSLFVTGNPVVQDPASEEDKSSFLQIITTNLELGKVDILYSDLLTPEVKFLLAMNECGRGLLAPLGNIRTQIPLSLWPKVLSRATVYMGSPKNNSPSFGRNYSSQEDKGSSVRFNEVVVCESPKKNHRFYDSFSTTTNAQESMASVVYYLLRNGPALADRGML